MISVLLILVALFTRGIWYHSDLYLGDIWTAQDALHKTAHGYRSSLDYFNPIGPAMEWLFALTLFFTQPSSYSLVLANVLVASWSLILTTILLRQRAQAITLAIVGLIAVTTALSPRDVDTLINAPQINMLASYNRWAWALLMPVAMYAALADARLEVWKSVLTGFMVALLLLLKVTYGLAAIGIFFVVIVLYPASRREIGIAAVAMLASILVLDWVSDGQVRAYVGDLALSAQMPSNGVRFSKLLSQLPSFIAFSIGCLLLISAARHGGNRSGRSWRECWRIYIVALAVGASGLVVLMQNHYMTEAATLLLMPLIVADRGGMLADVEGRQLGMWTRHAEWIGALILVTLALPAIDAGCILAQKVQTHRKMYLAAPFKGTEFANLVVDETYQPGPRSQCNARTCSDVKRLLSGRQLISQYCRNFRSAAVLAFNFSNPFPAFLGSRSPRHAPIWLDINRSFSSSVHVPGEKLFSDVSCVVIAKNDRVAVALDKIYGEELRQLFRPVANNEDWFLWVRLNDTQNVER